MKMFHVKRQLLALFMPGFLLGILYVNLEAEQFAAGAGIFSEYFLKQYQQVECRRRVYLVSLAGASHPVSGNAGAASTKFRKGTVVLFLIWTGFSAGLLFSMAVSGNGSQRKHPVCNRNASTVFILYPFLSDRTVVCLLLSADAVEYPEESGFWRNAFNWIDFRIVCESYFIRSVFKNSLIC